MKELLEKGNISSNTSSCGSPNILALKKDGAWRWRSHLVKSQAKYKARQDKNHVDHCFQVGDEVRLCISKEKLQGEKSLKLDGPTLIEYQGDNVHIYSIEVFSLGYLE